LGVAEKTIRNAICRGSSKPFPVRPVKLAGRVLFRRADLDKLVESLCVKKTGSEDCQI